MRHYPAMAAQEDSLLSPITAAADRSESITLLVTKVYGPGPGRKQVMPIKEIGVRRIDASTNYSFVRILFLFIAQATPRCLQRWGIDELRLDGRSNETYTRL
jgi:hypothetical protein